MNRALTCHLVILCLAGSLPAIAEQPTQHAASEQSLDWFADKAGTIQPLLTLQDWQQRRSAVIAGFEEAIGTLPSRTDLPDLEINIHEEEETDLYTKQSISFLSEPGDRVAAYLYLPKGLTEGEKRPGIVALHPTGALGKKIVDGQGPRPNRAYAKELAELGYVVIAPDYPSFGDSANYDFAQDRHDSGIIKGIWNHMRCVDLLTARDDVFADRIATIGHSLGGHNAIFFGVFDPRVKVVVSSCGWTPFHDYYGGDLKGWTSERYAPAIRDRYELNPDKVPFDYYGLIAALAPAAFFSSSPLEDSNFDYRGVEKAAPKIRRIYELYDVPHKMRIAYPDADHDFPTAIREEAYRFIETHLATD